MREWRIFRCGLVIGIDVVHFISHLRRPPSDLMTAALPTDFTMCFATFLRSVFDARLYVGPKRALHRVSLLTIRLLPIIAFIKIG
jgi:hypothetical protein